MSANQFDFSQIADEVASQQADANVAKAGGGSYTPPPKGLARLRLVGYIELGQHVKKITGKPDKKEEQAWLIFELSGKGYEPKELEDGTKIPMRITVKLNKSLNEKATYYKLFKRMNYEQKATNFIQLLGQPFLGNVGHFEIPAKEAGGQPTIIANFRDDAGNLTIRPPRIEAMDEETGDVVVKPIPVAAAVSEQRCLVWNAKPEHLGKMWASLYIPEAEASEGDDGKEQRSRNVYQNTIKSALNFEGSPIHQYLQSAGVDLGIPEPDKGQSSDAGKPDADDPLNGVG